MKRLSLALTFIVMIAGATMSSGTRLRAQQPGDQLAAGISSDALTQIDALVREKESRSPAQQKIDSQLLYELRMESGVPIADGIFAIETDLPYAPDGHIVVDIAIQPGSDLASRLTSVGLDVESVSPDGTSVRAHINIGDVEAIAADATVIFVQPKQTAITTRVVDQLPRSGFPERARAVRAFVGGAIDQPAQPNLATPTGQGSQSSEGDVTHRAFVARGAYHVDGTGVKIGVLSDGVSNLAASQARGDLGSVTVLPGQAGSGDEGTAMLEIVHDLAPGAQLFFATAVGGINSFAQNIRDLRTAGCDIIIDDVFYFVETPFEDGQPAPTNTNGGAVIQAVNDVTAAGVMYFSSAGNSGNLNDGTSGTWEGDFVDGGATALPLPAGARVHSFAGQNFNVLTVASGNPTNLYWSDPLGGSSNDYDLFRLNATGTTVLAASTNIQSGTQDPYEQISSTQAPPNGAAAGQRIVIVKKAAAALRFLHLGTNRGRLSIATAGQTHGHSSAANAFGVAATPAVGPFPQAFSAANSVETFSSDGPRRVFFQANGTAYTPGNVSSTGGLVRQQPVITAADGVSVTGVGGFPSPFFGTSAAAPHAGAIAALIKSANPALTAAQIRTILINTAIDIEAPGVDRDSGAGIVMAQAAVGATGVTGTAFLALETIQSSDNPGNGNGLPEAGEGARLTLTLKNYGVAAATNIATALTTSTPGITITQPSTRAYPDLPVNASAANAPPLLFTVAADFPCPATAKFSLNVALLGGPSQMLLFGLPIGPPNFTITTTLDGVAPPASPGVLTIAGSQDGRLNRNAIASACGSPKPFPGTIGVGTPRAFEAYAFQTCAVSAPSCVNVTLASTPVGANAALFASTYQPSFVASNISTNYKADPGVSNIGGGFVGYSFDLSGGAQTFVIDVNEVNQGLGVGASYTLNVSGACLGACAPPNHPPVAKAKNVTVPANNMCLGTANVDNGSFDPDGDPITLVQAPPNPYPLGQTSVLLTVSDPKGAMSQATGIVTVADQAGPAVTGVSASPTSLWPPNHDMLNVTVDYGAADNCPGNVSCVLSVSSNEASNNKEPDWVIVDAHHVLLRAERAGDGVGRVYTITLTCTDAAGNVTVKTATVLVPHDQA